MTSIAAFTDEFIRDRKPLSEDRLRPFLRQIGYTPGEVARIVGCLDD